MHARTLNGRIGSADAYYLDAPPTGNSGGAAASTGASIDQTASKGEALIQTAIAVGHALNTAYHWIFPGHPSSFEQAPDDVRTWIVNYAPTDFEHWMEANAPGSYGSIDNVLAQLPIWLKQYNDWFIMPGGATMGDPRAPHWYSATVTPAVYAFMGYNYQAMVDNTNANPDSDGVRRAILSKHAVLSTPTPPIDQASAAINAVANGTATDAQAVLVDTISNGKGTVLNPGPTTSTASVLPLLLVGGAALAISKM